MSASSGGVPVEAVEPRSGNGGGEDGGAARSEPHAERRTGKVPLETLSPQYDEDLHKSYLDRLEEAITDPRNRNIALSGRYGTGKSSVLTGFQAAHGKSTRRLAVSTLAPDVGGNPEGLTNRIQKEVLKQLLYSAGPRTLRHSRFSRPAPLPWWRSLTEAVLLVGVIGMLLALLDRLPSHIASGPDHTTSQQVLVWVGIWVLLSAVLAAARTVTHNRYRVSEVSAAGTKLAVAPKDHSYFDEHLDEIVRFFDQEDIDFVIFEDLDRYDDPQIFQALRELNTLLNNTQGRREEVRSRGLLKGFISKLRRRVLKKRGPLRFIYAMRDSLFERIGEDPTVPADAARTETVRANRTKFFDVVIPMAPFLSHRTAGEHLQTLLQDAGIIGIDRALIELVAKHSTDMRLLTNLRNEYLVFAERLLEAGTVAPGLNESRLFALVAYKNFHPQDFEHISRRDSDLDRLYEDHRALVAEGVARREERKRDLLTGAARPAALDAFAKRLGERLCVVAKIQQDQSSGRANWQLRFLVNSKEYDTAAVGTPAFWIAVDEAPEIKIEHSQRPGYGPSWRPLLTIGQDRVEDLFPELRRATDAEAIQEELVRLDREIEYLRGADFRDLAVGEDFTLTVPATVSDDGDETDERTEGARFGALMDLRLKSELAKDLVRQGYLDRNFTLYSTQFYGEFTGADVATFIVQIVQTNTMDINYRFTSPGALANLLAETDADFTSTISAYNIQLMDHLLAKDDTRADEIVQHITTHLGSEARQFLSGFFTSKGQRTGLAARLSRQRWPLVFSYLVSDEGVPADVRATLVDAALLAADPEGAYDLGHEVGEYLVAHYEEMTAFTKPQSPAGLAAVEAVLRGAKVRLPRLDVVQEDLRARLVVHDLYELTAENLRSAAGITGPVGLDQLRDTDVVYRYSLDNLAIYLDVVLADDHTPYSVHTADTLIDATEAAAGDRGTLMKLTQTASRDSSLHELNDAPPRSWPPLAAAGLFEASLPNINDYLDEYQGVDEHLARLLLSSGISGTDQAADPATRAQMASKAAIAVLNAKPVIPGTEDRVRLVRSLAPERIPAAAVTPESSNLFALLLQDGLVPDDAATFAHIRKGGWAAVGPATVASTAIEQFLTPALLEGMVGDLFEDPAAADKIGKQVLSSLATFVPTDDKEALVAAADYAIRTKSALPVDQIRRVAVTCRDANLTVQLLHITSPSANEIVMVLRELGEGYANLTTWGDDKFEVPNDQAHEAVFKILQEARLCKTSEKPRQELLIVKRP